MKQNEMEDIICQEYPKQIELIKELGFDVFFPFMLCLIFIKESALFIKL